MLEGSCARRSPESSTAAADDINPVGSSRKDSKRLIILSAWLSEHLPQEKSTAWGFERVAELPAMAEATMETTKATTKPQADGKSRVAVIAVSCGVAGRVARGTIAAIAI